MEHGMDEEGAVALQFRRQRLARADLDVGIGQLAAERTPHRFDGRLCRGLVQRDAECAFTDAQIDLLAEQMRSRWGNPEDSTGVTLPPYSQQDAIAKGTGPGDSQRGATVYNNYCSECHGTDGRGGKTPGSIVDPGFLKMVSDQSLRTTVIVGRRYIGESDCRANTNGQPLSAQEVSDVVAWLASQRSTQASVERAQPANPSSTEIKSPPDLD